MSKICAICGKPLDSGVVVHPECVPHWIPVEEGLPEPLKDVLTYVPDVHRVRTSYVLYTTNEFERDGVSHCMPLPEPPKEASNAQDKI